MPTVIDINILYLIVGVEFVFALLGVIFWFYSTYIKKIFRARILDEFGGTPKVIKELICKPHIKKFTWNKGTYLKDSKLDSLDSRNNPIGYWWKDDLRQIEVGIHNKSVDKDNKESVIIKVFDPRILQTELDAKDMQDLTHGERDKIYFIIIGGLALAIVLVAIVAFYFYNSQTDKLLSLSRDYASLIANMTKINGGGIVVK